MVASNEGHLHPVWNCFKSSFLSYSHGAFLRSIDFWGPLDSAKPLTKALVLEPHIQPSDFFCHSHSQIIHMSLFQLVQLRLDKLIVISHSTFQAHAYGLHLLELVLVNQQGKKAQLEECLLQHWVWCPWLNLKLKLRLNTSAPFVVLLLRDDVEDRKDPVVPVQNHSLGPLVLLRALFLVLLQHLQEQRHHHHRYGDAISSTPQGRKLHPFQRSSNASFGWHHFLLMTHQSSLQWSTWGSLRSPKQIAASTSTTKCSQKLLVGKLLHQEGVLPGDMQFDEQHSAQGHYGLLLL